MQENATTKKQSSTSAGTFGPVDQQARLLSKDTPVIERHNNAIKFQNQPDASRLQTLQGGRNVQMSVQTQLRSGSNSSP